TGTVGDAVADDRGGDAAAVGAVELACGWQRRRRGGLDERARAVVLAPSGTGETLADPARTRRPIVLELEVHRRDGRRGRDHRLAREAALAEAPAHAGLGEEVGVTGDRLAGPRAVA